MNSLSRLICIRSMINSFNRSLYENMVAKGYDTAFSARIAGEMHTPYLADRMLRYISRSPLLPLEEVADEMLSILSERDALIKKHIAQNAQQKLNEFYRSR